LITLPCFLLALINKQSTRGIPTFDFKQLTMGASSSSDDIKEIPNKATVATLYYFAGRGLADQIRQDFSNKEFKVADFLNKDSSNSN
jgi:hypothetical protein